MRRGATGRSRPEAGIGTQKSIAGKATFAICWSRGISHQITGIKECVFVVPNAVKFTKACLDLAGTIP